MFFAGTFRIFERVARVRRGARGREIMAGSGQITLWLQRLRNGDEAALHQLVPLVYDELRLLARRQLRGERAGHTLSTTDLVNEAYLRLVDQHHLGPEDRPQFFAIAATTMRRILVDYARTRKRLKRGGGQIPIPLDEAEQFLTEPEADEVLALDAALDRLGALEPRVVQVVQCRFYGGMTLEDTARALGISVKTAQRDWTAARAWLRKEIAPES
jgi:RNA polymerase sigma-70 factor, ECF subfamily